jgi:hypothetical protein
MKRGSREIENYEGISIIASRHVRHRYRTFQNFRPVAVVAKPIDEQKKVGEWVGTGPFPSPFSRSEETILAPIPRAIQ